MKRITAFILSAIILLSFIIIPSAAALYFFSGVEHYTPGGEALGLSGSFSYPEMCGDGSDMWVYFNMALIAEDDCRINIYLDCARDNFIFIGTDSLGVGNDALSFDYGSGLENFNNVVFRIIKKTTYCDIQIYVNEEIVYMGAVGDAGLILSQSFAGEVIGGAAVIDDYHLYRNDSVYTEISTGFDSIIGYDYLKLLNIPGDVDGDGFVTSSDVILLRRYFAHLVSCVTNPGAADFNRDGKINSKDLLLLRMDLAGGFEC